MLNMRRIGQLKSNDTNEMLARVSEKHEVPSTGSMGFSENENVSNSARATDTEQTPVCIKKKMQKHSIDVRCHKFLPKSVSSTFRPRKTADIDVTPSGNQTKKKRLSCNISRASHSVGRSFNQCNLEQSSTSASRVEDDPKSISKFVNRSKNYSSRATQRIIHCVDKASIASSSTVDQHANVHNNGLSMKGNLTSLMLPSTDIPKKSSTIESTNVRIYMDNETKPLLINEHQSDTIDVDGTAEFATIQSTRKVRNEKSGFFQPSPVTSAKKNNSYSSSLTNEWKSPDNLDASNEVWKNIAIAGYEIKENDDFEPIPYNIFAAGMPVDADDQGFLNQSNFSTQSSPFVRVTSCVRKLEGAHDIESPSSKRVKRSVTKILLPNTPKNAKIMGAHGPSCNLKKIIYSSNAKCRSISCIRVVHSQNDAQQIDHGSRTSQRAARAEETENKINCEEAAHTQSQSKSLGVPGVADAVGESTDCYHVGVVQSVNASAFHSRKQHDILGLDEHSSLVAFDKFWKSLAFVSEDNEICHIPHQIMASGIPIDADNYCLTKELAFAQNLKNKTSTLGGSIQPLSTKTLKTKTYAKQNRNNILGEKHNVAYLPADNRSTRGKSEIVGPDSWQMTVVFQMIVFLEETAADKEISEKIDKIHIAVEQCISYHAKRIPKYLHLPGAIFEELVNILGGPQFLRLYESAKTFHHPRLEASRRRRNVLASQQKLMMNVNEPTAHARVIQKAIAYGWYLATEKNSLYATSKHVKDAIEQGSRMIMQMSQESRNHLCNKQACHNR